MIKVLVVETTEFGYDGISNVVSNYYIHIKHDEVCMDIVTINPIFGQLRNFLDMNSGKNFVLKYRNKNPLKYIGELKRILRKGKYDILHVHGCSATMATEMLAGWLSGVKVRIAHSHNTKCDHVIIDKVLRPAFNKFCTHRFACGQEAGEWLFGKRAFYIISNGIDIDRFKYDEGIRCIMRKKYALDNNFVIGHVGRFSEQKNHKKLIDVFVEISKVKKNAKLVLVGDGELKEEIQNIVSERQQNVLFVGLSDEVEKWLQVFDIVVFPSLFEGLPLGLVEAQAASLPCLLSNTISPMTKITELVEFISLDASDETWAEKVLLMTDGFERHKKSKVIEKQINDKKFNININCEELVLIYSDLLREK